VLPTLRVGGANRDVRGINLSVLDTLIPDQGSGAALLVAYHIIIAKITSTRIFNSSSKFRKDSALLVMLKASLIVLRVIDLCRSVFQRYWI
jgi:hypothetical protein